MSDAISREDALMCLTGEIKETDTIETIIARFVRRIRKLPSVTPQQSCEDIAKAFQLGMALGFAKKHDEVDKVMEEVKKAVTLQPKTGHWIDDTKYGGTECSECGKWYPHATIAKNEIKYCSECGAKMVEPQESEG